jgi:NADH:ubiquinone oxidoreductase subunit 6 (subunit J)
MLNLFLALSMGACINSHAILSMLLFLILTYLAAAFWLISQHLIYAGLLYVLVYVGAIVVLFVYVIQLVDTVQPLADFSFVDSNTKPTNIATFDLLIGSLILIIAGSVLYNTNLNLNNELANHSSLLSASSNSYNLTTNFASSLDLLAQDLFNSYGYVMLLTVTAIILAIIGPVNLALLGSKEQ